MKDHSLKNGRAAQPDAETLRLRKKIRQLRKTCRNLAQERDEYFQAHFAKFKDACAETGWNDFDPADYKYSLEDILTGFEKEHSTCLPRNTRSKPSTPARSAKKSRKSSGKQAM
jgi:hypothetical protein